MVVNRYANLLQNEDDACEPGLFFVDKTEALISLILSPHELVFPNRPYVFASKEDGMDDMLENLSIAREAYHLGVTLATVERRRRKDPAPAHSRSSNYEEVKSRLYELGRVAMAETEERLDEELLPSQTTGEQFAETALFRLLSTYDCIAVLFALNKTHDALVLCRCFVEQLAWSIGVCIDDVTLESAMKIKPNRCMADLKQLTGDDKIGKLYGVLSNSVHLRIDQHYSFLTDGGVVLNDPREALVCSSILPYLAELWCICYEKTQTRLMSQLRWISEKNDVDDSAAIHVPSSYAAEYYSLKEQVVETIKELKVMTLHGIPSFAAFEDLYRLLGFEFRHLNTPQHLSDARLPIRLIEAWSLV